MRLGATLFVLAALVSASTNAEPWRPGAGLTEVPLWPRHVQIARPAVTGPEEWARVQRPTGQPWQYIANVTRPTMTIYPPQGTNTGAAVMVFPGGGYNVLAIDLEGTEICDWLTSRGVTCVLLKYRVPGSGPHWNTTCHCRRVPPVPMALQDAQRAMRLLRQRASSLGVDPHRIGVVGFSAGGHLVAAISNTPERTYARFDAADDLSSVPDFAMPIYPGHLWAAADEVSDETPANSPLQTDLTLAADIHVTAQTPPTFIVMAEDDPTDDVRHGLSYYMALRAVRAPVEMHLYAHGGHAFGLRHTDQAITEWPVLAERWMRGLGVLPAN